MLEVQRRALERYESVRKGSEERLVSGSDDNTLIMWLPEKDKKPLSKIYLRKNCESFYVLKQYS